MKSKLIYKAYKNNCFVDCFKRYK